VRSRRAYFDCRFGQLHVRTAFPTTGGFDEGITLVCLHAREGSSRSFAQFLPEIAADRSVYAPDLPGFGESDAAPTLDHAEAARAVGDLVMDLRLRQIDLLGVRFGAAVALDLACARPDLVRRLVLVGAAPIDETSAIKQQSLIIKVKPETTDEAQWNRSILQNARVLEQPHRKAADLFETDLQDLAKQIGGFLRG
jgi:pimeloyl-ACP methyl ester carboxylesterase